MVPEQDLAVYIWSKYIYTKKYYPTLTARTEAIKRAVNDYFNENEFEFLSVNTSHFMKYLNEKVGEVSFAKLVAMNIKNGLHIYVDGVNVTDTYRQEFNRK